MSTSVTLGLQRCRQPEQQLAFFEELESRMSRLRRQFRAYRFCPLEELDITYSQVLRFGAGLTSSRKQERTSHGGLSPL